MATQTVTLDRLTDIAAAYRDAQHTTAVQRRRLRDAVAAAIDTDRLPPAAVAKAIGVSIPRVYAVLAAALRDDT